MFKGAQRGNIYTSIESRQRQTTVEKIVICNEQLVNLSFSIWRCQEIVCGMMADPMPISADSCFQVFKFVFTLSISGYGNISQISPKSQLPALPDLRYYSKLNDKERALVEVLLYLISFLDRLKRINTHQISACLKEAFKQFIESSFLAQTINYFRALQSLARKIFRQSQLLQLRQRLYEDLFYLDELVRFYELLSDNDEESNIINMFFIFIKLVVGIQFDLPEIANQRYLERLEDLTQKASRQIQLPLLLFELAKCRDTGYYDQIKEKIAGKCFETELISRQVIKLHDVRLVYNNKQDRHSGNMKLVLQISSALVGMVSSNQEETSLSVYNLAASLMIANNLAEIPSPCLLTQVFPFLNDDNKEYILRCVARSIESAGNRYSFTIKYVRNHVFYALNAIKIVALKQRWFGPHSAEMNVQSSLVIDGFQDLHSMIHGFDNYINEIQNMNSDQYQQFFLQIVGITISKLRIAHLENDLALIFPQAPFLNHREQFTSYANKIKRLMFHSFCEQKVGQYFSAKNNKILKQDNPSQIVEFLLEIKNPHDYGEWT